MGTDHTKRFYISKKHSQALKILEDLEKEGGGNSSDFICTAVEFLGEYVKRRSPSHLDYFVEQERKRRETDKRIDEFVLLIDGLGATTRGLLEQYDPDQLKKLNTACMILHYKLDEALTLNAGR